MTREIHRPMMLAVARPDALYQDLPEKTLEAQLADLEKKLCELPENDFKERRVTRFRIEKMKERIRIQDEREAALDDSSRFARKKDLAGRGQMYWTIAIEDRKNGRVRLVRSDDKINHSDPDYGDVHIIPCFEEGDRYSFGAHEFNRDCYCRPRIKLDEGERPMVIHKERQAN